jgi:hypothetical protein
MHPEVGFRIHDGMYGTGHSRQVLSSYCYSLNGTRGLKVRSTASMTHSRSTDAGPCRSCQWRVAFVPLLGACSLTCNRIMRTGQSSGSGSQSMCSVAVAIVAPMRCSKSWCTLVSMVVKPPSYQRVPDPRYCCLFPPVRRSSRSQTLLSWLIFVYPIALRNAVAMRRELYPSTNLP